MKLEMSNAVFKITLAETPNHAIKTLEFGMSPSLKVRMNHDNTKITSTGIPLLMSLTTVVAKIFYA